VLRYSLSGPVIIFDRMREHVRTMRNATAKTAIEVFDSAITAAISRTIITQVLLIMTVTMLLFGGPVLQCFALALRICFSVCSSV
jgi:preprotein translocase subunit SecF